MVPHFPLGYFSEQNTGARVTYLAGGDFHAHSHNSLALIHEENERLFVVGEDCVTSQKDVSVGDNTAYNKLNSSVFCEG